MDSLQPIINLLVVLSVLSMGAERATNLFKLHRPALRDKPTGDPGDAAVARAHKIRERDIAGGGLLAGVLLSLAVKADFFEILGHLDAPWETLGWVSMHDYAWVRSPATASLGAFLYACGGCLVTGLCLGFGSSFWHDLLGTVLAMRDKMRELRGKAEPATAPAATTTPEEG